MNLIPKLKNLDQTSKIAFILLIGLISYIVVMYILRPIFIPEEILAAHTTVMGDHLMTFTSPQESKLNVTAIALAVGVALAISLLLHKEQKSIEKGTEKSVEEELKILKKALSSDQKKIIEEIEKAGEITQDSLRFRLDWSKAKISTLITNLDKMNIVQRRREGKTYVVFLSKK